VLGFSWHCVSVRPARQLKQQDQSKVEPAVQLVEFW
jgi:hypothetical protein